MHQKYKPWASPARQIIIRLHKKINFWDPIFFKFQRLLGPNSIVFIGFRESARGGNRTGDRPVPTSPRAVGPTMGLISPWNLASLEISHEPKIQASS